MAVTKPVGSILSHKAASGLPPPLSPFFSLQPDSLLLTPTPRETDSQLWLLLAYQEYPNINAVFHS